MLAILVLTHLLANLHITNLLAKVVPTHLLAKLVPTHVLVKPESNSSFASKFSTHTFASKITTHTLLAKWKADIQHKCVPPPNTSIRSFYQTGKCRHCAWYSRGKNKCGSHYLSIYPYVYLSTIIFLFARYQMYTKWIANIQQWLSSFASKYSVNLCALYRATIIKSIYLSICVSIRLSSFCSCMYC